MSELRVAIGCDHAGFPFKEAIINYLRSKQYTVLDFGTDGPDSVDYPDYVHPLADSMGAGEADLGVLICGSGNGVCMTANKHKHIRAALIWEEELAALARKHNNANVICLPARFMSPELAVSCVDIFLHTDFEGGRHQRRVDKIENF